MAEMRLHHARPGIGDQPAAFVVTLGPNDNPDRAERILWAAVLQINDVVSDLYEGAVMPARTSELERGNYRG